MCLLVAHLAEEVHHIGEDDKQDTTTRSETQHLGGEALVQSGETLLLHDRAKGRPGPVVLGSLAGNLGGVLDAGLDDVHGGVEESTSDTTNGTSNQVVTGLLALVAGLGGGQLGANLEDTAEVTGVPEDVTPQGRLETVVHGQWALSLHNLLHNIKHTVVLAGRSLVLQTNLDQLEGNNNKRLSGTSGGTGQNSQTLGLLLHLEQVAVEGTPAVIGSELGGTLGGLHQDGCGDTAVQGLEAAEIISG